MSVRGCPGRVVEQRAARETARRPFADAVSVWAVTCIPLAALAGALGLWLVLPLDALVALSAEGGPIEWPCAVLWFVVAFAVWWQRLPDDRRASLGATSLMLGAFGARELDWHKAFTDASILKTRFYLGAAPWGQKLVGLIVVGTVVAALTLLLRRFVPPMWRELRQRTAWSVTVATFVAAIVLAKLLDRVVYGYAPMLGIVVPAAPHVLIGAMEELLELSVPLIAAWGISRRLRPGGAHGAARC